MTYMSYSTFRVTFFQVVSHIKWKKAKACKRNNFLFKPPGKRYVFSIELALTRLVIGEQTQEEVSSFEPVHD